MRIYEADLTDDQLKTNREVGKLTKGKGGGENDTCDDEGDSGVKV
jgi:hypothetical protein